jgi:hypothetical protein
MVREKDGENFICFGPLHKGDVAIPVMLRAYRRKGSPSWCQACVNEEEVDDELDPQ